MKRFFGEALDTPNDIAFSHLPRWSTTAKAKKFYSSELSAELNENAKEAIYASFPKELNQMHPFNRSQYIESKSLMAGYLLTSQGDRMLAKNSVEGRFPFLDHRVIEFANRVPPKYKMKGLNEKSLLKKAMARYLPKEIVHRHKQPYRAPDMKAMSGDYLVDELRHYLTEQELTKVNLFDANKVKFLLKKADSGKALSIPESQALVGILSTQIIVDKFINN
ncbi:MAG: asparagine synthase C-terminal domain-containing protein [Kangiellaceae bacterium]|nr:asparagine synthase C-terminal domain-containing protein [Kangiellaceae bacterium]